MNKNKKLIIIIAVVFICITFSRINVFANTLNEVSPEALAVTLVIDNSGSMATTDNQKLRETAANIFIDLLSPEDYLSIITFNTKEEVVLPMQKIQSSDNKVNFKKMLSQRIQSTGDTDYVVTLNEASKQLSSVNNGKARKVILFLTDGEPDPDNTKKNDSTFMHGYMDSLWKEVSNLALNKYEVYSVGFSKGIDLGLLERISSETKGTVKISEDSSELALSFFDILGNLKNRKNLLNETIELKGKSNLEFDLDEYTAQATMVFVNLAGTPFDVTLSAPDGKSKKGINVNKFDKYNIITVNKEDEKLTGKWKVNLTGNGNIKAFGNKDLFIKSWLVTPEANSLYPLNEPLDISVNVTGEVSDRISVEATVTKDGIQDEIPIKLEFKDGLFSGTYNNVDKIGKYDIEIRLILNGQVITNNNVSFFIRELPSIFSDFKVEDTNFRLGEKLIVTSSLNMKENKLMKSDELKIENYNLVLNYINSGACTISLLDNGLNDTGDTKANDGIWSNKVVFNKEDGGKAALIVNGTYKGEKFLLEKSLGNFKVYPPGNILIEPLNTNLYTSLNNVLKIPLEIENTSNFTETMIISLDDESIGKLAQDRIKIEPLNKIKTYLYLNLDKNLEKKVYDIGFKMTCENADTKIEPAEFNSKVEVLSKTGCILRYLQDNMMFILMFLGIIVGVSLLIILLGLLLYKRLVYRNTIVQGKLSYWKESDSEAKEKREFDFSKLCKETVIITFNKEKKNTEYRIFDSKYDYDIELTVTVQKIKWKFIGGYKALFHRNKFSELILKTTEPGIFIYEDKIFTSKKIYNDDKFTTGEYVFQYFIDDKEKSIDKNKGKNLLEER